jgi:hypothetical protein
MWKEMVMAYLRYYSSTCMRNSRNTIKKKVRIAVLWGPIMS